MNSIKQKKENAKILQELELENLKFLISVCNKYNLRYYLVGGTLIGVLRHQGFIPWDDDIDVAMPRPDYNKFVKLAKLSLPEFLDIKTKTSDPNYKCYYTRVINNKKQIYWDHGQYKAKIGVWMDVFPIDGLPNNIIFRWIHVFKIYIIKMLYKFSEIDYVMTNKKRNFVENFLIKFAQVTKIGKSFDSEKLLNNIDKELQKYDYDSSKYAWNYSGGHALKEIMPISYWSGKRTGKFEGMDVSIIGDAEKHLTYIFGDYMTIPPEEKRYTHIIEFVN